MITFVLNEHNTKEISFSHLRKVHDRYGSNKIENLYDTLHQNSNNTIHSEYFLSRMKFET